MSAGALDERPRDRRLRQNGADVTVARTRPYEDGLRTIAPAIGESGRTLVVFLGSNIGNFDPPGGDALARA